MDGIPTTPEERKQFKFLLTALFTATRLANPNDGEFTAAQTVELADECAEELLVRYTEEKAGE
jgi:hypothetical protein